MAVPLSVLIVEDSQADALLIIHSLRRAGFEPLSQCVKTETALRQSLREGSWEIVLADYSLPGFSGRGALKLVQQLRPDLPFILVSGAVGEDTAVAMMKAGANDFILKDNFSRLGPAIERELREAEVRRAWQRAEEELHDREARFRSIIENVSDMIVVVDTQGTICYQSPSVERVLGYHPKQFTGRPLCEFVQPDDLPAVESILGSPTEIGRPVSPAECRLRHRDSSWRILEAVVTSLVEEPAVQGLVFNFRDVTERKRLETELIRTQRLESLGSLAGGIAHDLNNLLTPILIAAEVLAEEPVSSEYRALVEGLQISAERATDVVQHLLSFARGIDGKRQTVKPAELLNELDRLLQFSLPKLIARRIAIPAGLWPVSGDQTELLQVLVNLSINARDAMPDGGRLTVDAQNVILTHRDLFRDSETAPGPYVHFRVTDTGEGIRPRLLDRIFEPFFTTKERGRGTGIGLSTSLSIIHGHGGFLQVYSDVGRGTRFSIYVPALPTPEVDSAKSKAGELPRGNSELVLVVDDEASIREVMKETLEAYGYRVLTASDGVAALDVQSQQSAPIDLAIVDIGMTLMDGPTTIRALRQVDPSLCVIAHGGFLTDSPHELAGDEVDELLEKPYTTEQLLRCVARVLRRTKNIDTVHACRHY